MTENEERPSIPLSTCHNVVKFRKMLVESRSEWDDRIIQRLNAAKDCREVTKDLRMVQDQRLTDIRFCLEHVSAEERRFLESELVVEDILRSRTDDIIESKCN